MSSLQTFSRQSLVLIGFIRKYNITLTAYCINTMEFGNFNLFTLLQFRTRYLNIMLNRMSMSILKSEKRTVISVQYLAQ